MEYLAGDVEAARHHLLEALRIQAELGTPMGLSASLFLLAVLAMHDGQHRRAAGLLGAAARIRQDLGGGMPSVVTDQHADPEAGARQALGDDQYEQARAEGYAMTLDEAVAFALQVSE